MKIQTGTKEDRTFIGEQLIAYNRQHVPKALYEQSEELCLQHLTRRANASEELPRLTVGNIFMSSSFG